MEITLEKKHEDRLEFVVDGITPSFANMVRRYCLNRVPALAIDSVTFYDNTTSLWDEYIAHRLGMMPLTLPDNLPVDFEVVLSLDETGPKIVYSKDLKSTDKDVKIAQDSIVVLTLGPNQHLRFEAKAKVGIGKTHAKYQAGLISYGIKDDKFRFVVESFHQTTPAAFLKKACDEILLDTESILDALEKKAPKKAKVKAEKAPAEKKKKAAKKKEEKE